MKKFLKWLGIAVLSVVIMLAGYVGLHIARVEIPAEWYKVTDPNHPGFDPYRFKFSDYDGCPGLTQIFRDIFEIGMPKSEVDKILGESGGTKCIGPSINYREVWHCSFPKTYKHWDGIVPKFIILYNEEKRLLNSYPCMSDPIFSNSVKMEDLKLDPNNKINAERVKQKAIQRSLINGE